MIGIFILEFVLLALVLSDCREKIVTFCTVLKDGIYYENMNHCENLIDSKKGANKGKNLVTENGKTKTKSPKKTRSFH